MTNDQSELSAWLAELEKEQAERAVVIASIRQRLGLANDAASPTTVTSVSTAAVPHHAAHEPSLASLRGDTFFGMSVPEAIKKYLAMAKRPQTPKQIGLALEKGGVHSLAQDFSANVSTSLKRLRDSGIVVNTGDGWGLSVWYPGRKQAAENSAKPSRRRDEVHAKPRKRPSRATGWHQFLGEATKRGKSMAEA